MKETTPLAVDGETKITNLVELEQAAKKHLTINAYGYYSGGAEVGMLGLPSRVPPLRSRQVTWPRFRSKSYSHGALASISVERLCPELRTW